MAETEIHRTINAKPLLAQLIVQVRMPPLYGFRRWIAMKLIKLAATLLGCGIEFEVQEKES